MLEKLLEFLAHLKAGAAAGVFVVGATGVLITGTVVNGDVRLQVSPAIAAAASPSPTPVPSGESSICVEAVRARDDALRAAAAAKEKALTDLQTLKEIAASLARKANKDLRDETLTAAQREVALEIERVGTAAAREIRQVLDLAPCEDGDPATGLVVDVADLRQRYKVVVDREKLQLQEVLQRAAGIFEKLVREAPAKKPQASSDSGGSDDSGG